MLWGKVFRNFRRTKKDRRGRNLRLSLHDYHSLPAMIAQTPAPRKSFQPFSPVLRKSFHERPEIFGQFIVFPPSRQSPGAKFGSSCAEVFHKRPCGPSRLRREAVSVVRLYEQYSFFVTSLKIMYNSLCILRMDKPRPRVYNKARNQRSTAEAQMRANPADFKQKGAKTDGRYGARTVRTDCRGSLRSKTEAHHKRDVSPV